MGKYSQEKLEQVLTIDAQWDLGTTLRTQRDDRTFMATLYVRSIALPDPSVLVNNFNISQKFACGRLASSWWHHDKYWATLGMP